MKTRYLHNSTIFSLLIVLIAIACERPTEPDEGEDNTTIPVEYVQLNSNSLILHPGELVCLYYAVYPENATVNSINWSTSDDNVATVYQNGAVSAIAEGSCCITVNCDGKDWIIIEGKAKKVESDSDKTLFAAAKAVAACTNSRMSRVEKLHQCFNYIKTSYLEGVRHDPPYTEMDWPIVYANDLYVYGKGDCFSYGAAYAYMGKAIGYEEVYACNTGGHGWAEIEGKYYDPEWDMHHQEYNHFGVSPEDPCDVNYSGTLLPGVKWMRIKI